MQLWKLPIIAISAALFISSGCGDAGTALTVSGTVTLDGDPLPEGLITILPMEGGKPNSGDISAGQYKLSAEPGNYKVEISRMVSTGTAVTDPDYGIETESKESIHSRYNTNSQLRMKVAEGDSTEFNFSLEK